MRAGPISAAAAAHGRPAVNVSGLKLLAINAARTIQYRLSRRRAGRCCAATAFPRAGHNRAPEDGGCYKTLVSMSFETIQLEMQGPVCVLTLNRPERLNALT